LEQVTFRWMLFLFIFWWYWDLNSRLCTGMSTVWDILPALAVIYFYSFPLFCGMEFELWAPCLQGRCSTAWNTPPVPLCSGYYRDGVSQTLCLGWRQTVILLILASQLVRITSMSHQQVAFFLFDLVFYSNKILNMCTALCNPCLWNHLCQSSTFPPHPLSSHTLLLLM
jgi:hypothetical protein